MTTITLEAPGKNAISSELMKRIQGEIAATNGGPILLRGSNGVFSAGMNLKEVAEKDETTMVDFLNLLEGTCQALFHHPGPTVAFVEGHAIAGGSVLALCCDRIIAQDNPRARIGLNEVALGLRFPPRIFDMLRYRIPAATINEVILQAGLHGPQEALRLGLGAGFDNDCALLKLKMLKRTDQLDRNISP